MHSKSQHYYLSTLYKHSAVYLSFGGENLFTNAYVAISQLGSTEETALVCRTDQTSGDSTGSWFNPSGTMIEFNANSSQGFYSRAASDGILLLQSSGIPVEGIYTCRATDSTSTEQTIFVGLYNEDGGTYNKVINKISRVKYLLHVIIQVK